MGVFLVMVPLNDRHKAISYSFSFSINHSLSRESENTTGITLNILSLNREKLADIHHQHSLWVALIKWFFIDLEISAWFCRIRHYRLLYDNINTLLSNLTIPNTFISHWVSIDRRRQNLHNRFYNITFTRINKPSRYSKQPCIKEAIYS